MKHDTAVTLVLVGIGTAVITSTIKEVTGSNNKRTPAVYIPIGGVLAAVPLLIMADIDPDLAGMFGGLIGLGALLINGGQLNVFAKATNPQTKLPPNSPPPPKVNATGTSGIGGGPGNAVQLGANAINQVVQFAQDAIGIPYGTGPGRFGPTYFDCSGLTYAAYQQIGITIGQDSYHQVQDGVAVPIDPNYVRAGDLIFTRGDVPVRDFGHVALAISNTEEIVAPRHGTDVQIAKIPYGSVQAVRRIVGG